MCHNVSPYETKCCYRASGKHALSFPSRNISLKEICCSPTSFPGQNPSFYFRRHEGAWITQSGGRRRRSVPRRDGGTVAPVAYRVAAAAPVGVVDGGGAATTKLTTNYQQLPTATNYYRPPLTTTNGY